MEDILVRDALRNLLRLLEKHGLGVRGAMVSWNDQTDYLRYIADAKRALVHE